MQPPLTPQETQPECSRDQTSSGLTLLELALAILVLALASLAALHSSDQSRRAIGGEIPRLMARIAVQNRIEELALYGTAGDSLPEHATVGLLQISLTSQSRATTGGLLRTQVTGRAQSGEGAVLVAYLPAGPRP